MTARRFAEDTRVPVVRTREEVRKRLKGAGADQIATAEGPEGSSVMFRIGACAYRVTVPINFSARNPEQDERRAWRLLGLLIKAKLEAVREGATTIEREFLADMMMGDGRTVSELVMPQIAAASKEGRLPRTLLLGGPGA